MRRFKALLVCGSLAALVTGAQSGLAGAGSAKPASDSPHARSIDGVVSQSKIRAAQRTDSPYFNPGGLECLVTHAGFNTKLDCDDPFPNNEEPIQVDPLDPNHVVSSSNDYGTCCDEYYTSFDGGQTWNTGNMSAEGARRTGSDPVDTFDVRNTRAGDPTRVIHSSLNYVLNQHGACDGDVVVSISKDGGLTYGKPVVVDSGLGCDDEIEEVFNDKEWITTDNNPSSPFYGRTYLTWTAFTSFGCPEAVVCFTNPIKESHSDDGGQTWTPAQEISGFDPVYCSFDRPGDPVNQCNDDQDSIPVVAPDGTVYVQFVNDQNKQAWESSHEFEDQILVVRSTDGGVTWSDPVHVIDLENGNGTDYPTSVRGRITLTGYQFRVDLETSIAVDPRTGLLYSVFADNRAGVRDTGGTPVTDSNVYIQTSADGVSWSPPAVVSDAPSDQFYPWVAVNPVDGRVGVLYYDRRVPDDSVYNTTLAEGGPGAWTYTKVSSRASHPRDSVFFRANVDGCMKCVTFIGDYIGLAYGGDGVAHMVWTDMRFYAKNIGSYFQHAVYARL
jgi:hypothetical protein